MNIKYSILTVSLLFSPFYFAYEPSYNFNLLAKQDYSLFDGIDDESTAKEHKVSDQQITIKWAEETKNMKRNIDDNSDIEISWKDGPPGSDLYENKDDYAYSSFSDWFSSSEQPEIFKKRKITTSFRKNDPFYGKHLCGNGEYTCFKLKRNDSWTTLFPDKYQRELVQRINRTNKGLWNRNWILVPNDINRDYMDFSPLPDYWDTNGRKTIVVDISELAFAAYDKDGDIVHWGPVNPGKDSSKTVRGRDFKVYRKGDAECWSKKYESYIPYCIFFHKGFAMHGYSMPGYAASHGCVRTYVDDALWLNKNFADYKTRVIVQD